MTCMSVRGSDIPLGSIPEPLYRMLRALLCLIEAGIGQGKPLGQLTKCRLWNPPEGFPRPMRLCLSLCSSSRSAASSAMPKSPSFTAPLPPTSRLPVLTSRCRDARSVHGRQTPRQVQS